VGSFTWTAGRPKKGGGAHTGGGKNRNSFIQAGKKGGNVSQGGVRQGINWATKVHEGKVPAIKHRGQPSKGERVGESNTCVKKKGGIFQNRTNNGTRRKKNSSVNKEKKGCGGQNSRGGDSGQGTPDHNYSGLDFGGWGNITGGERALTHREQSSLGAKKVPCKMEVHPKKRLSNWIARNRQGNYTGQGKRPVETYIQQQ